MRFVAQLSDSANQLPVAALNSLVSEAVARDEPIAQTRARVCSVLGQLLASSDEQALSAGHSFLPGESHGEALEAGRPAAGKD